MLQTNAPIYVLIGTKAQYIKTAPLMRLMQEQNIDYYLIDSGQHAQFTKNLREELKVKHPDVIMQDKGNIKTIFSAGIWFLKYFLMFLFAKGHIEKTIFQHGPGYCFLHGDTPSTLIGLFLAKRVGQKVIHIEAGLRSYNNFKPFPEELIRIICMRYSDYLFAPSAWAADNISRMKHTGKVFDIEQNTNVEALYYSMKGPECLESEELRALVGKTKYCIITIHRVETILNKSRLEKVLDVVEGISQNLPVVFVLHDPTVERLKKFNLMPRLQGKPNIITTPLLDHSQFLALIENAEFIITDGGSIQEESYYLDVPCMVMRTETERQEGLGNNVVLGDFDDETISGFLRDYNNLRRGEKITNQNPSKKILEIMLAEMKA